MILTLHSHALIYKGVKEGFWACPTKPPSVCSRASTCDGVAEDPPTSLHHLQEWKKVCSELVYKMSEFTKQDLVWGVSFLDWCYLLFLNINASEAYCFVCWCMLSWNHAAIPTVILLNQCWNGIKNKWAFLECLLMRMFCHIHIPCACMCLFLCDAASCRRRVTHSPWRVWDCWPMSGRDSSSGEFSSLSEPSKHWYWPFN